MTSKFKEVLSEVERLNSLVSYLSKEDLEEFIDLRRMCGQLSSTLRELDDCSMKISIRLHRLEEKLNYGRNTEKGSWQAQGNSLETINKAKEAIQITIGRKPTVA